MERKQPLILVVDDEENNVDLLQKRLKAFGFQTISALEGKEALLLARCEHPDLILLDIMMPEMSGYEVLIELKKSENTREIPVILLSARVEVEDKVKGLSLGAVDYITKPFHPEELLARVNNALQQKAKVQKLKDEAEQLRNFSMIDELTGLFNRRYLKERFQEEMKQAQRHNYPLACLMIDIDYFKEINDTFGHLLGDKILAGIARLIRSSLRASDVVGRYGGEEFIVLLPQTDKPGALSAAEKLRKNLEQHVFRHEGHGISVTASIGIAVYHGQDWSLEDLIDLADFALYQAKKGGRNRVVVLDT